MDTMLIQVTNQKAVGLLHELEELQLIKVLKDNTTPPIGNAKKYKGIFTSQEGDKFNNYLNQVRSEWDRNF